MNRLRFRVLGTTADASLLVWGKNLPQLFSNAASGLFRVLANPRGIRPLSERVVRAEGSDIPGLLVSWLSEWIFLFDTEGFLGKDFLVDEIGKGCMVGSGWGEAYQPGRHHLGTVVKGVTYHRLEIKEIRGRMRARVVLDL